MTATTTPDIDNERLILDDADDELTAGDVLLDTRSSNVLYFRGVEDAGEITDFKDRAVFDTAYSETRGRPVETKLRGHVDVRLRRGRFTRPSEWPLPVGEATTVGDWHLSRIDGDTVATWTNGTYHVKVGKGYSVGTKADYGLMLKRPKYDGSAENARECILYRGDGFEEVLNAAVDFMENVSIDEIGDDDHAWDYFVSSRDTERVYPDTLEEGDIVEYNPLITEISLSSDPDETLANNGKPTGVKYGDDVYRGEVVSVREDTVFVNRFCHSRSLHDTVTYDQIGAKLL